MILLKLQFREDNVIKICDRIIHLIFKFCKFSIKKFFTYGGFIRSLFFENKRSKSYRD